jgi:hypothetical protein
MSRGNNGTITPINRKAPDVTMQGIVIGGVANGVLIKSLKVGTELIELGRPTHAKPMESPHADIEFAKETDRYCVNTFFLPGEYDRILPFALVTLEGKTPSWAMTQLVKGFVLQATEELKKENLKL